MTLDEFEATLLAATPQDRFPPLLAAMWWVGKEHWGRAHEIAQDDSSDMAAWIHAYLHRKEGDSWNAGYWYRRARRTPSTLSLDEEWREIVTELLDTAGLD